MPAHVRSVHREKLEEGLSPATVRREDPLNAPQSALEGRSRRPRAPQRRRREGAASGTRRDAPGVFPAKHRFFIVELRGFEPLISAVQSQIHNVVVVRLRSEIAAKWRILSENVSCSFAAVRVGWCTTGVNEPRRNTNAFASRMSVQMALRVIIWP